MIAYNKEWLTNEDAKTQIENAFAENNISKDEKIAAEAQYPSDFYTPNIFIRIGLALLSLVIIVFSFGLLALLFFTSSNESESAIGSICILFGLICYAALEWFVNTKNHYRSGVDDALLWMAPGFVFAGLNFANSIGPLSNSILILLLAFFLTLRFADKLMALVAAIALLAVILFSLLLMGNVVKNILPFALMIASALLYFSSKKLAVIPAAKHYQTCLTVIGIAGLVCIFLSGNYYIVREASVEFFGVQVTDKEGIPFGWVFWILTVGIPLFYIFWGVLKKDIILIRTGLLLVAAMVFTVRYYYDQVAVEKLMIAGGILLTAIAYLLTKYLKEPKAGFTSEANSHTKAPGNIEALIIAETLSGPQESQSGTQFGGGSFGGGGASADF